MLNISQSCKKLTKFLNKLPYATTQKHTRAYHERESTVLSRKEYLLSVLTLRAMTARATRALLRVGTQLLSPSTEALTRDGTRAYHEGESTVLSRR